MAKKKRTKPTNPEAVQVAGLLALQVVRDAMIAAGLRRLVVPIRSGDFQLGNSPVKAQKACVGCPPLPDHLANKQRPVWRAWLIIKGATELGGHISTKEILRCSRNDGYGDPIPARTLGRALNLLRKLREVHYEQGKGYRYGAGPVLFAAT